MLPIFEIKQALLDALKQHGQVVVSAPTGSGKSTQIPQFLLEYIPENSRLLVLQPRRLATRMLAERIAYEMNTKLGEVVGYQTRYERVMSAATRILFITEGILTRMLVNNPALPNVAAIVFDEFHERSLNTDLGLAMAVHTRRTHRPDLQLVVMSATLTAEPICAYLGGCPHLHAEGRLFPIDITYLKPPFSQNVFFNAAKAIRNIVNSKLPGDILVFMPGAYEIRQTQEECRHLSIDEQLDVLPLYGDLPPELQRAVMNPTGHRKVIIATNIAETSLTIPGVRHVIDSGLVRTARYEAYRGINLLETRPVARDAADQRAGRAGREAPGTCQRLWNEIEQNAKPAKSVPEIQRLDLAETVMAVASYGFPNPFDFPWFDAPPEKMLREATSLLEKLGILKENYGGITELGRQLLAIPAHPRLALLLYFGATHGCLELAATAAAIVSERPLVTNATTNNAIRKQQRQEAHQKKRQEALPQSDFLHLISLLQTVQDSRMDSNLCQDLGLNPGAVRDVLRAAQDLANCARRCGWPLQKTEDPEQEFLKCLLRAFPDKLARRRDQGTLLCNIAGRKLAELDKNSVIRDEPLFIAAEIRETAASGVQSSKLVLSLASGIREQWLWDEFPDAWRDVNEIVWDDKQQRVLNRSAITCLGLVMEETLRTDPDPEKAAAILAEKILSDKLALPNWDDNVEKWLARVRWTAQIFPGHPLPSYDDNDRLKILQSLCYGETAYRAVKSKDCLEAVRHLLSNADIQFVESMAPAQIILPKGRRMKIDYVPGQPPKGRARIQDIYDMTATVRVAGGRIPILMDILAPNNRTVQITQDMESFWSVQYPKIKPALSRRYPKHEWR